MIDGVSGPVEVKTFTNPEQEGSRVPRSCGGVPAAGSQQKVGQSPRFQVTTHCFTQYAQRNVTRVLADVGGSCESRNPLAQRRIAIDL